MLDEKVRNLLLTIVRVATSMAFIMKTRGELLHYCVDMWCPGYTSLHI